jgi:hypothetical protein
MTVYNYNHKYNNEGQKTEAFIFSALGNACASTDFNNAQDQGQIDQQTHDALLANVYGGDIAPKSGYWLKLI